MHSVPPLQRVQNVAARLVLGTKKYDHITLVLMRLHWLPVQYRVVFKVCLLVFECLNGQGPNYLRDPLNVRESTKFTRSAHDITSRLMCPRARLVSAGDRIFSVVGPRLWNRLGVDLRESVSVQSFKSGQKTHLFQQVF